MGEISILPWIWWLCQYIQLGTSIQLIGQVSVYSRDWHSITLYWHLQQELIRVEKGQRMYSIQFWQGKQEMWTSNFLN